ncbi:hypothetical protein [Pandoraea bronchicola]|uniref:hypothetical protein n=1 Tax=Pandoraea bronchicola TaxID=2508287 RepID=UPI001583907E|nr:hypothetical protein [Pandoraea bronchicola]
MIDRHRGHGRHRFGGWTGDWYGLIHHDPPDSEVAVDASVATAQHGSGIRETASVV